MKFRTSLSARWLRLLLATLFAVLKGFYGYGQTTSQQACMYNFFHDQGYSILQVFAHPTCTAEQLQVRYDDANTWYVVLTYKDGEDELSCTYKISMSSGMITGLRTVQCNSDDFSCFEGCNILRDWAGKISQQDKDRFQRLLVKLVSEMTCQDICLASLYYQWLDKGYYNKFVSAY